MAKNRKRAATSTQPRTSKRPKKLGRNETSDHESLPLDESIDGVYEANRPDNSQYRGQLPNQWIRDLEEGHRKDTWLRDFQAEVIGSQKELLEILNDRISAQKQKDEKLQHSFRELLQATITPIGMSFEPGNSLHAYTLLPVQPLYMKSARLLEASRELLKTYQGLTIQNPKASQVEGIREELTKEAQLARELITAGKTSIRWDVKRHLEGTKGELRRSRLSNDTTLNEMVETMLEHGREEKATQQWSAMAADVKKAYRKVYKIAKRFEKGT